MHKIPKGVREEVYSRDSWEGVPACIYCGTPYGLHLHHVVELSRGGRDIPENLVTLCYRHHNGSDEGVHFNKRMKEFCMKYLRTKYPNWDEIDLGGRR